MQWLLTFLYGLVQEIFTFFIKRFTFKIAVFFAWASFTIGLFISFVSLLHLLLAGVQPFLPEGVLFAMGLFPPVVFNYAEIYFTALIAKRVYDWKQMLGKQYYQTKGMAY